MVSAWAGEKRRGARGDGADTVCVLTTPLAPTTCTTTVGADGVAADAAVAADDAAAAGVVGAPLRSVAPAASAARMPLLDWRRPLPSAEAEG
jgi:hypothetical protein